MKTFAYLLISFGLLCSQCKAQQLPTIFQISSISALSKACYKSDISIATILKHGDFGLGTFDKLDGEMICINKKVYQISADGSVRLVKDTLKTPFSVVTNFKPQALFKLKPVRNLRELEALLDSLLDTKNLIAALHVKGKFKLIKARSVKAQVEPFPPLIEAVKQQSVFEFTDLEGELVGFRFPDAMDGINVAGYHFHFMSKDKKKGGHLINCEITDALVEVQLTHNFQMLLPTDKNYLKMELSKANQSDIHKIEKQQ